MSLIVLIESVDGAVATASLESLGAARELVSQGFGSEVVALCAGGGHDAALLGDHGAQRVLEVEDLGAYSADGYAEAFAKVLGMQEARGVFAAATVRGRELLARVASLLDLSVYSEAVGLEVEDGSLVVTRPLFAGKVITRVRCNAPVACVSLRPKVFAPKSGQGEASREGLSAGTLEMKAVVQEILATAAGKIELTEADIIVSGGRGTGGPEGFAPIEALAEKLGAAVGASRAVVDSGWRPHSDQVGQTGKVVNPTLYIACGISGAIQHLAGMKNSRYIVAINKDPEAPIFKVADYGIVGDLFEVCPALTAAL